MQNSSTKNLIISFTSLMAENRDPKRAARMSAYMKNLFSFFGIPSPLRAELGRSYHKSQGIKSLDRNLVSGLWAVAEREAQYAAMDHIKKFKKQLTSDDIPWLESLIQQKSWWDTVDFLAVHAAGEILSRYPDLNKSIPDKWISSTNIWLKRTALLYQLKYKKATDFERLRRYILLQLGSKDFFINKASGWALREYAKTNPIAVKQFVEAHPELANLTKREALKHLGGLEG